MTYNVFSGTLFLTQPTNDETWIDLTFAVKNCSWNKFV